MMHLPRPRHEKNEKNENGRNYHCFSAIQIPTHRKMSTVVVLCGNSTIGRINITPYAWKKNCAIWRWHENPRQAQAVAKLTSTAASPLPSDQIIETHTLDILRTCWNLENLKLKKSSLKLYPNLLFVWMLTMCYARNSSITQRLNICLPCAHPAALICLQWSKMKRQSSTRKISEKRRLWRCCKLRRLCENAHSKLKSKALRRACSLRTRTSRGSAGTRSRHLSCK